MRDHEKQQACFNWKVRLSQAELDEFTFDACAQVYCEDLVDQMSIEKRRKLSQLSHERVVLKRIPNTLPNLRDGRGGGGWPFHNSSLLSTGNETLAPISFDGCDRQRRQVSLAVRGLSAVDAQQDLIRLGVRKTRKAYRSSSPERLPHLMSHIPSPLVEQHRTLLPPPWPTSTRGSKGFESYIQPTRHNHPTVKQHEDHRDSLYDPHKTQFRAPPAEYHPPPKSKYWTPRPIDVEALQRGREKETSRQTFNQNEWEKELERGKERIRVPLPVPPLPLPSRNNHWTSSSLSSFQASGKTRNDLVIPPYKPVKAMLEMPPPPAPRIRP